VRFVLPKLVQVNRKYPTHSRNAII